MNASDPSALPTPAQILDAVDAPADGKLTYELFVEALEVIEGEAGRRPSSGELNARLELRGDHEQSQLSVEEWLRAYEEWLLAYQQHPQLRPRG